MTNNAFGDAVPTRGRQADTLWKSHVPVTPFNRPISAQFGGVVRGVVREPCTSILDNEHSLCKRFLTGLANERLRPYWQALERCTEVRQLRRKEKMQPAIVTVNYFVL